MYRLLTGAYKRTIVFYQTYPIKIMCQNVMNYQDEVWVFQVSVKHWQKVSVWYKRSTLFSTYTVLQCYTHNLPYTYTKIFFFSFSIILFIIITNITSHDTTRHFWQRYLAFLWTFPCHSFSFYFFYRLMLLLFLSCLLLSNCHRQVFLLFHPVYIWKSNIEKK